MQGQQTEIEERGAFRLQVRELQRVQIAQGLQQAVPVGWPGQSCEVEAVVAIQFETRLVLGLQSRADGSVFGLAYARTVQLASRRLGHLMLRALEYLSKIVGG